MDQLRATEFVTHQLNERHSHQDIVRALCGQTGWPQKHVESFVQRVEAEYHGPQPLIAARRPVVEMPFLDAPGPAAAQVEAQERGLQVDLDEDTIQFVIGELAQHRGRDAVVRTLCEQAGWDWQQSERFVRKVEIEHYGRIVARQSPLVILLGVGGTLAGLFLVVYTVLMSATGVSVEMQGLPYSGNLFGLVTGLGLFAGGIAGVWRAISLMRESR